MLALSTTKISHSPPRSSSMFVAPVRMRAISFSSLRTGITIEREGGMRAV